MRMEFDQVMNEFAQTPGAPRASNVTWRGLGCRDTASRTEPTTADRRPVMCSRLAWRAQFINVALRKASLEDLADLHLADTTRERATGVALKSFATFRTMKLRHGRRTPQLSGRADRPLQAVLAGTAVPVIMAFPPLLPVVGNL